MMKTQKAEDRDLRRMATIYRVRVAGILPVSWEDRLGSLRIVHEEGPEPLIKTTLMGAVKDQAELLGVINALYELRLPLLLVEALDQESVGI